MSDNTANAREPSMEDILASIRRIIDEEDTRDARPASDHVTSVENRGRATPEGALPVMAAASVSRDDDDEGGLFDEVDDHGRDDRRDALDAFDTSDDDGVDSVFPERESPFWSRATGRDAQDNASDGDGDYAGAFDAESDRDVSGEDTVSDDLPGTRTDIFTRAQNKLESGPRLSTRERMQSLAARAEERAEATTRADVIAPVFGRLPNDDDEESTGPDLRSPASEDASHCQDGQDIHETAGRTLPDDADVLELTDPMEQTEAYAEPPFNEPPFARTDDLTSRPDDREDEDTDTGGQGSTASYAVASETNETSSWSDDADSPRDRSRDMDDVLDLTTPLGDPEKAVDTGSVESGDAFHVSDVEEDDPADQGIEDVISRNLVRSDADRETDDTAASDTPVESHGTDEFHGTEDSGDIREHAPANTYSRFDSVDEAEDSSVHAATEEEADDTYSAAFVTLDDAPSTSETPVVEETTTTDEEEPIEASVPEDDEPESGENLGFPDTFGASDVYHDEPPALDEDYSRSLDDGDELAAEQAAFAAQMQKDDGMEAVGGMVRDAMERDPVDYSDPAALVSMTSEEISARALASLADVEGEASRRVYGSLKISENGSGSGDSLEGMVRGMLKPMLREWLDDNLPSMVESAVRGEVERISSKSRKYSRAADDD